MQTCDTMLGPKDLDEPPPTERIPPSEGRLSGIRVRVPYAAATVDIVVCDLRRDPRSEDFVEEPPPVVERPPSKSTVRALQPAKPARKRRRSAAGGRRKR